MTIHIRRLLAAGLVSLLACAASAQIRPDRAYFGVNRPLAVTIDAPAGSQNVQVALLHPVSAEQIAIADVSPGRADLAALFPQLWGGEHQHVHYAQVIADGKKVGAALVLQPTLTPQYAYPVNPQNGQPQVPPRRAEPMYEQQMIEAAARQQGVAPPPRQVVFSGIRAWVDQHVVVETSHGEIAFRLRPDQAPNTCWNFLTLVRDGFYTDIIFHRIVAQAGNGHPFVIQVGDPTGTGSGGPGYFVDLEPTGLAHDFGVLSMARSGEPNSNGSQVFVCLSREGTAFLDGRYTAFAEAVSGADVIRAIAAVPVGAGDRPIEPPVLISARLVDAPPHGEGPKALSELQQPAGDESGG